MMPFQFSINLDLELRRLLGGFEVVVPSSVIAELETVAAGRKGSEAKAALRLAARYRTYENEGSGDDAVLASAVELGAVLLTNDGGLRRRARRAGLQTICLRGKNHLEIV
ncbi:MAG: twitching motility protein PilT [Euryarchaeota archaeon]|nr:twitching motility protein PilT [Euryarchaeota archaeon]